MKDNLIKYGILYSDLVKNVVDKESIKKSIEKLNESNKEIVYISAEDIDLTELNESRIIINTLGDYYLEGSWNYILDYYKNGGIILNIGSKPFTKPYSLVNGELRILNSTEKAIHTLFMIDEYVKTGELSSELRVESTSEKYNFIKELWEENAFPKVLQSYSIYYQLAEKSDDRNLLLDSTSIKDSELEIAATWYDKADRAIAAPISRVDHFYKGAIVFLNFDTEDNYYNSENGVDFLSKVIKCSVSERFSVNAKTTYPLYREGETPELTININRIERYCKEPSEVKIEVKIFNVDSNEEIYTFKKDYLLTTKELVENININDLKNGFYGIEIKLINLGKVEKLFTTGFYLTSEDYVSNILSNYERIKIDTKISTDFTVQNNKPFLMHGANYHVSDNYRMCFIEFNPHQCDKDLLKLKNAKLNMLRTGNWQSYDLFYNEDGSIKENILRNIEAFYLTAARHGFTAQFVLGAFIMNHWDREKCPIHNPEIRKKTINAFKAFAKHLAKWPNVQIDAINEPSYSIKGLWKLARPSEDLYEKREWIKWLKNRYSSNIELLRECWGVGVNEVESFEEAELPIEDSGYERAYDRQETIPSPALRDFYDFAFESYSSWVTDIKNEVKKESKEMMFMIGRDENLRVPTQQYEAYKKNIDMVNMHHWHKDSFIFSEYLFNKVRGIPLCGQEIGVYHFGDQNNNTRLNEDECAEILERKLLYSFGNWIQWQAYNDPYLLESIERSLGLIRADKTETPYMNIVRILAWVEENMKEVHLNRNEDIEGNIMVFPTSEYFSVDSNISFKAILRAFRVFFENTKLQANVVLENLLLEDNINQIGDYRLMIIPACLCLSEQAWKYVVDSCNKGKTILLSGITEVDEYWNITQRLKSLGIEVEIVNAKPVEKLKIDDEEFQINFRETFDYYLSGTVVSKMIFNGDTENKVQEIKVGNGKLLVSPLPIEFSNNDKAIAKLYNQAAKISKTDELRLFEMNYEENKDILIYPMKYKNSTLYTIVNEGVTQEVKLYDKTSKNYISLHIEAQRGSKLWIDHNGDLQGAYLNGNLDLKDIQIKCNGTLGICRYEDTYKIIPGKGVNNINIKINNISKNINVIPFIEYIL